MINRNYQRRSDLDWLRVLAFTLLILFHTGMGFNTWNWHVKNNETTKLFEYIMIFLNQWRMPLLFFISGSAVWFAMDKYGTGRFAWERIKRLLIPLIFGMLVIVPPQVYFERVSQGVQFDSYAGFYETVFQLIPYPEGNFSWHHLWYLPYILIFSLLMLPVFTYLKKPVGKGRLNRVMNLLSTGKWVYFCFVPLMVSQWCLRPFWPDNFANLIDDWAQFTGTLIIFCLGFIFASNESIWKKLENSRITFVLLGSGTVTILYFYWYTDLNFGILDGAVYWALKSANIWFWICVCLGFGSKYLRFKNRFLQYANQAVYPFYVIHQTITVALVFYIRDWPIGIFPKFILVALLTFLISWVLYEFPIKRSNLIRPLFGLKMHWANQTSTTPAGNRLPYPLASKSVQGK
jgi:surface polysaccharide O-acyltransferase-like enzyme